jgi:sugar/nucleoside kinase (ribokinase family)
MSVIRYTLLYIIMSATLYTHEPVVLSIGEPVVDLIYYVDDAFLTSQQITKGGSVKIELEPFLALQQQLTTQAPFKVPGGSAANTLKGLAKLNHACRYVGKIGKDSLGEQFRESLQSYLIEARLLPSTKHTTQVLSLVTPDGQRTMRCCFGASDELRIEDLTRESFENVTHVHIEGYTAYKEKILKKILGLAKEVKATISIDLASREVVQTYRDRLLVILQEFVDIVIANEDEAKALTGLDPEAACAEMQNICPIAVVLLGENGCLVGNQGTVFASYGLPVCVVDTTGAGDLFASGFLHGFLTHEPLETCAYYGNLAGSTCVTEVGAQISDSNWKRLRGLMNATNSGKPSADK